jgi:nitroreductase
MDVHEAIMTRRSIRRFLPDPIPMESLRRILEGAGRAPSGHNIQPWKVYAVAGAPKERLSAAILDALTDSAPDPLEAEFDYYPTEWVEPYIGRRRKLGFDLYSVLGIAREDKEARGRQMNRNFTFFDAPVALFVTFDRRCATGTFMDIGMFIENILLGARGEGLHTCGQAAFLPFYKVIAEHLSMDPTERLACAISIGYEDPSAPENRFPIDKLGVDDYSTFIGFED